MIQVGIYDRLTLGDVDAAATLETCARQLDCGGLSLLRFDSPLEFVELTNSLEASLADLVVIPYEMTGMNGVAAFVEARNHVPQLAGIIVDGTAAHATEAARGNVDAYLPLPVTEERFSQVANKLLKRIARFHETSFVVPQRNSQRRIGFTSVIYCETSGHDQIIHLKDGPDVTVRCSSQVLFDLMKVNPRYFKLGSSYIVNLDEVQQTQNANGMVLLRNGTVLTAPARLRKTFEDAILA